MLKKLNNGLVFAAVRRNSKAYFGQLLSEQQRGFQVSEKDLEGLSLDLDSVTLGRYYIIKMFLENKLTISETNTFVQNPYQQFFEEIHDYAYPHFFTSGVTLSPQECVTILENGRLPCSNGSGGENLPRNGANLWKI